MWWLNKETNRVQGRWTDSGTRGEAMRRLVILVLLAAAVVAWAYYERRPISQHLSDAAAWVKKQAK